MITLGYFIKSGHFYLPDYVEVGKNVNKHINTCVRKVNPLTAEHDYRVVFIMAMALIMLLVVCHTMYNVI